MTAKPRKWISSYDANAPTPEVGSEWIWEKRIWSSDLPSIRRSPLMQGVNVRVAVEEVKWNGEEWWVKVGGYWNDLSRFWEAVSPAPAQDRAPAAIY